MHTTITKPLPIAGLPYLDRVRGVLVILRWSNDTESADFRLPVGTYRKVKNVVRGSLREWMSSAADHMPDRLRCRC